MTDGPPALAVIHARAARLPVGAAEAVAEAGGEALVVGEGALEAAADLVAAERVVWAETGRGLFAGALAAALAPVLADVPVLILPASPDGRDLAPRLAAALGRSLLAGATSISWVVPQDGASSPDGTRPPDPTRSPDPAAAATGGTVTVLADLARLDGQLLLQVECSEAVVATLVPGSRAARPAERREAPRELVGLSAAFAAAVKAGSEGDALAVLEVREPEPSTMDLEAAPRILAGGAGLAPPGTSTEEARALFSLLVDVAAALGASAGATRVATDAGWIGYERQIGTTGVIVDPALYVAFGVSGATQHVAGIGTPAHVVSVNTDPSCPMTGLADLGIVADAAGLLRELARRLGVPVPELAARTTARGGAG